MDKAQKFCTPIEDLMSSADLRIETWYELDRHQWYSVLLWGDSRVKVTSSKVELRGKGRNFGESMYDLFERASGKEIMVEMGIKEYKMILPELKYPDRFPKKPYIQDVDLETKH